MRDDAQLIDEVLAGNREAFGELVLRYQDRLFHTLVHVVPSEEDACDIVQDAFVQAYLRLASFQRMSAFYTWLYRIAFNVAMSRQRRKRPVVQAAQPLDLEMADATQSMVSREHRPDQQLEQQERATQVRAALLAMGEEHRAVLVLREMDGCQYETIADILGVPVGTIRSRLHRARVELRHHLHHLLQEDLK